MKFPYKKFSVQPRPSGPASIVARPVIPIHVTSKQRVAYEALVDSGADYSIFHAEVGEAIGLEVRKGHRVLFAGVSGATHVQFFLIETESGFL